MRTKQKILISTMGLLFTLSIGKIVVLIESKSMLEDILIEHKKTISLYEKFMGEITGYVKSKGDDKVLLENLNNINEYMKVYSTPQQKGKSSYFQKEIQDSLKKELESKLME